MKVYIVGRRTREGNKIVKICATKEIAKRELFKFRDDLVAKWKKSLSAGDYRGVNDTYMGEKYKDWVKYLCDYPYIKEHEVVEK